MQLSDIDEEEEDDEVMDLEENGTKSKYGFSRQTSTVSKISDLAPKRQKTVGETQIIPMTTTKLEATLQNLRDVERYAGKMTVAEMEGRERLFIKDKIMEEVYLQMDPSGWSSHTCLPTSNLRTSTTLTM